MYLIHGQLILLDLKFLSLTRRNWALREVLKENQLFELFRNFTISFQCFFFIKKLD